jgi:hypothetical protein
MEPSSSEAPKLKFGIKNLLAATVWVAIALGLTRLYPDTSDAYIDKLTSALPVQALLTLGIFSAIGGLCGEIAGRHWLGLGWGVAIGLPIVVVWAAYRFVWIVMAANQV